MNLIFDIETDGLLDDFTSIHCIGIYDLDCNETYVFNDEGNEEPISRAVTILEDADNIIGHNIIGFDIPAIKQIYPFFNPRGVALDTLVLSRIYHADILSVDNKRKWKNMPLQLYGRHSLEAWGHRLLEYKGDFSKTADWKKWSAEMQEYMLQDITVTQKLWQHFHKYLTSSN